MGIFPRNGLAKSLPQNLHFDFVMTLTLTKSKLGIIHLVRTQKFPKN